MKYKQEEGLNSVILPQKVRDAPKHTQISRNKLHVVSCRLKNCTVARHSAILFSFIRLRSKGIHQYNSI